MLLGGACAASAADNDVTPDQVVGAFEQVFGVNKGERRNHIKGTCATGEFVGKPEAAQYSRSALFSGKPVPVVARFSLGGGNPKAPDAGKSPRGMALEFRLADGALQHMTMLNVPVFGAAVPKTFFDQLQALQADPKTGKPDPEKLKAFAASHPDSHALGQFMASHNPPPSYANAAYFGIHTFKFTNAKGEVTPVRWRFVPEDGEKQLSEAEMKSLPADFLEQRLIERAAKGPVRWGMWIAVGQPGDPQDDPTKPWPKERKEVQVGTLTLTQAMAQKGAACEAINFDPMVMADGISPTNDPILRFRSPSYAISFGKRLSGQ
ncbi:catalase family peroxidase [Pseudomonas sp. Milli4]|uniref:Catalase-related peroxidase n=2 Tax=Pseudomonas schmalbachii TaxID=2816993 RepID=A0ABS3TWQ2_9PSED|nr:catalase family peroxidase [Pseudomonas schmalbachii]